jgi:hypothetical protein
VQHWGSAWCGAISLRPELGNTRTGARRATGFGTQAGDIARASTQLHSEQCSGQHSVTHWALRWRCTQDAAGASTGTSARRRTEFSTRRHAILGDALGKEVDDGIRAHWGGTR